MVPPTSPQPLDTFVQNLIDDLQHHRVSGYDGWLAAEQYDALRKELAINPALREAWNSADEEKLQITLLGFFQDLQKHRRSLIEDGSKLLRYDPSLVQIVNKDTIYSRAAVVRRAMEDAKQTIASQRQKLYERELVFIREQLVPNFIRQLSRVVGDEKAAVAARQLEARLVQTIPAATSEKMLYQSVHTALTESLTTIGGPGMPVILRSVFATVNLPMFHQQVLNDQQLLVLVESLPQAIREHGDNINPRDLVIFLEKKIHESALAKDTLDATLRSSRATTLFRLDAQQVETLAKYTGFSLQLFAKTGIDQAAAVIFDKLPQQTRESLLRTSFSRSLERAVDRITSTTGQSLTPLLENAVQNAQRALGAEKVTAPGGVQQFRNFVADAIGTVLKSDALVNTYLDAAGLELITEKHVGQLVWQQFYLAALHGESPVLFHPILTETGNVAIAWGARSGFAAVTATGKKTAEVVAKRTFLAGFVAGGVQIGSKLVGVLSGPVGWILTIGSFFVGPILSFLGNIFRRFTRGKVGPWGPGTTAAWGLFQSWFGRGTRIPEKRSLLDNDIVIIAGVIVIAVFVVFWGVLSVTTANYAALVTSRYVGGQAEGEGGGFCDPTKDPSCSTAAFCDPANQQCLPLSCGCVSQEANGSFSHKGLNAADIAGFRNCSQTTHVPVAATHAGRVIKVSQEFTDNDVNFTYNETTRSWERIPGDTRPAYGNHVVIEGTDTAGKTFQTVYAHLSTIVVQEGDTINAGTPIGTTDNNGLSDGEHLHYEIKNSSVRVGSMLPGGGQLGSCWGQ